MPEFVHLHCHTQYSLLDGASEIGEMMDKAVKDNMKGVALTDHGNMYGAFKFVNEANKRNIKPIVGCEFYMVEDRHKKSFNRAAGQRDRRYHQLMLAKNALGYQNLSKLCSFGFIEGAYSKFPRIDKELILKYHEGLIVTSCCIGAIIPQLLIAGKDEEAEQELKWWLDLFGEDYYIEIQRHRGLDDIDYVDSSGKRRLSGKSQEDINQKLLALAEKHNVKVIATNDSHYVEEEDWLPHDLLLCINTGSAVKDEKRFKFSSSDYFFKSQDQMANLFTDVPQAVANTIEVYDKVETLTLARDILLPVFPMPEEFKTQDDFLRHLTYVGAKKRYGDITPEIKERLDFELSVIKASGYPGYFLIVQDFTTKAREMNVSVGPGRGSAAGSAVAYCVGITNVDPIKYDLLFERFLNPERVSMPDIDIDFDDEGRQKVIDYVIDSYGKDQVAQIITYGSMAARSSLRDVGRVMDIPLHEVDQVAKSFPTDLSAKLRSVLADGDIQPKLKGKMNSEDVEKAYQFRELSEQDTEIGQMIRSAKRLEGSIRNTGIHACGVIITPEPMTNVVPVTTAKDSEMYVTQFDNSVAEDAGLLKMDFLGLRTLTIIKDAVRIIKEVHDVDLEPDEFPLDDEKTYELFQRGDTIGIFQYESEGMQKHMRDLKPTKFEDLIAMNALYRPGPLAYIPSFIKRKHGTEEIVYDLADMEEYLAETYGITVYQEQVMLLSQKLADFTKGEADVLRKAMGKKQIHVLEKMKPKFLEQANAKGHDVKKLEKIWTDWEAFASYAFNKSHSTCYAFVAYQTAYLKSHYPSEFMAAVLSNNMSDIKQVNFFLRECKRQGLEVLGPDVNESRMKFSVNDKGQIRFGLAALKGVGEGPVEELIRVREGQPFTSLFDLVKRVNLRTVNKKCIESLAYGGGLDSFENIHRAQYFAKTEKYDTLVEHALKFGNAYQLQKAEAAVSLFGDAADSMIEDPKVPECEEWSLVEKLDNEKEVTGIFISGHPLDEFGMEIDHFTNVTLDNLENAELHKDKKCNFAGIVTMADHRISKKGTGWGMLTVQDFNGVFSMRFFSEDYLKYKPFMTEGSMLYISGQYKAKTWGSDAGTLEFRVSDMKLLETVATEKMESVTLNIPLPIITQELIDELDKLTKTFPGKHKLKMNLLDVVNRQIIELHTQTVQVNVEKAFTDQIKALGIDFSIN